MTLQRLNMVANLINKRHQDYSLLDLGCRTMDLKPLVQGCTKYCGTDFVPSEGVLECNLEQELPFESKSFDIVCALDVLEHLDNFHVTFDEALRVAKKTVIISLPNMYYLSFRLRFLSGKGISGKYSFPMRPVLDRHRWVLSFTDAVNFIKANVGAHEVKIIPIIPERGRTRLISSPTEKILAKIWPNLFVYGMIAEIDLE